MSVEHAPVLWVDVPEQDLDARVPPGPVAEKIGKRHLTYAQGAAAETVAATTILVTAVTGLPVSTTHVLNSGVAGTMATRLLGRRLQSEAARWRRCPIVEPVS